MCQTGIEPVAHNSQDELTSIYFNIDIIEYLLSFMSINSSQLISYYIFKIIEYNLLKLKAI